LAWIVTDSEGTAFELRADRGASQSIFGRSLRAVLDHQADVASVLEERSNHRAFELALVSLGALSPGRATSMAFGDLQSEMRRAMSAGTLHLAPYERNLRPICDMREIEATPLVEDEDDAPIERVAEETHWVELTFHDADGNPLADVDCRIERPDGVVHEGRTDATGLLRVDDISIAGMCSVSFPGLEDYVRQHFETAR
jgi:hypothetical protein